MKQRDKNKKFYTKPRSWTRIEIASMLQDDWDNAVLDSALEDKTSEFDESIRKETKNQIINFLTDELCQKYTDGHYAVCDSSDNENEEMDNLFDFHETFLKFTIPETKAILKRISDEPDVKYEAMPSINNRDGGGVNIRSWSQVSDMWMNYQKNTPRNPLNYVQWLEKTFNGPEVK